MKQTLASFLSWLLCFSAGIPAAPPTKDVSYPMKYEGGSLTMGQHDSLRLIVSQDQVVCVQGKARHSIPVKSITEISYGSDVHRRVGAAVGVGIVTFGVGALLALAKTKKHYVGITWSDSDTAKKGGAVFKVGKGEYRGVIAALEGLTGLKAVNSEGGGTSKP